MKNLTKHCEQRMSQRGISNELIELVFEYGESHVHDGADVTSIQKEKIKELRLESCLSNQVLDKLSRIYVVEIDGRIITTSHRYKRFKRNA